MSTPTEDGPDPATRGAEPDAPAGPGWWALGALLLAWAGASLTFPLARDQGLFAYVGDVVLGGGVPYRDAWGVKGPLTYYLYAGVQGLLGRGTWPIRLVDLAAVGAAALALARLARRPGARAGRWAVALFLLWHACGTYWDTAQPDGWAGMLVVAWAWLRTQEGARGLAGDLGAGVLWAAVFALKPPCALLAILEPFQARWVEGRSWREACLRTARTGAVAGVALAGVAAGLAATGALGAMQGIFRDFVFRAYSAVFLPPGEQLARLANFLCVLGRSPLCLPLALVGWRVLRRRRAGWADLVLLWVALGTLVVVAQQKYFSYHWTLVYAPLGLLVGEALAAAARGPRVALRGLAALYLVLGGLWPMAQSLRALRYLQGRLERGAYLETFPTLGFHFPRALEQAAAHVRAGSEPGEVVAYVGHEGVVNFLAGRPGVGRFGHAQFVLTCFGDPLVEEYRREYLAAFDARPPRYVVVASQDGLEEWRTLDSAAYLELPEEQGGFPALRRRLDEGYRLEERVGPLAIYRRVP